MTRVQRQLRRHAVKSRSEFLAEPVAASGTVLLTDDAPPMENPG